MATRYQIEEYCGAGGWKAVGEPVETKTLAEILAVSTPLLVGKKTRVVPVFDKVEHLPIAEIAAEIRMIKKLAEDLDYGQANYPATLESIIVRSRRLFDAQARLMGRGYRDGENTACQACDGVYPKEAR